MAHLKANHAYIFQDLPHHHPGKVRPDTHAWSKLRKLEDQPSFYAVPYESVDVAGKAAAILDEFGGSDRLRGMDRNAFARTMASLYGDLDRAHCFFEGNSRTLREFTRTLALDAGWLLDWTPAGAGAAARNRLYLARDIAVLERAYPGLTEERAMRTSDRAEYEAWFMIEQVKTASRTTLSEIIRGGLRPATTPDTKPGTSAVAEQFARFRAAGREQSAPSDQQSSSGPDAASERRQESKGSYDPRP
nr:Fic family protein [Endobacter medicaginis]